MIKNVLVTGASGRLGDFVAPYLHEQGYNVTCTDIVTPRPDSENAKLGLPFVKADLLEIGDVMKAIAMSQCDAIVHLGAIPFNPELQPPYTDVPGPGGAKDGIRHNYSMPEDNAMKINTMGGFYVLDAARRMGVKNVIVTTSFFAYGVGFRVSGNPFVPEYLPIDEEHPCWPEDTYSLSKYLTEEVMKAFSRAYGINTIAMRLLGVYNHKLKNHEFGFTMDGIPENVEERGDTNFFYREYVDSRDIARFTGLALEKIGTLPNKYEAFNVWTGTRLDCESAPYYSKLCPEFADMCKNLKGYDGLFSIEKARKLLGYEPAYYWKDIDEDRKMAESLS
ncbi:MAG: NAD(P)-dependent oxidoreductase [Oscillospiraceae bacterium]|nr:NAD(P)-dependent oxidoreductase [Oscillospiraceae bacterium]